MKNIALILFFFVVLAGFNSCCTKVYCVGINEAQIKMKGFTMSELELAIIVNTTMNDTIETYIGTSYTGEEDTTLTFDRQLNITNSYTIYIDSVNLTYTLSGFETSKDKCNSGFMCRDFVYHLKNYRVNGVLYGSTDGYSMVVNK